MHNGRGAPYAEASGASMGRRPELLHSCNPDAGKVMRCHPLVIKPRGGRKVIVAPGVPQIER